jgi:hypothetical protein
LKLKKKVRVLWQREDIYFHTRRRVGGKHKSHIFVFTCDVNNLPSPFLVGGATATVVAEASSWLYLKTSSRRKSLAGIRFVSTEHQRSTVGWEFEFVLLLRYSSSDDWMEVQLSGVRNRSLYVLYLGYSTNKKLFDRCSEPERGGQEDTCTASCVAVHAVLVGKGSSLIWPLLVSSTPRANT